MGNTAHGRVYTVLPLIQLHATRTGRDSYWVSIFLSPPRNPPQGHAEPLLSEWGSPPSAELAQGFPQRQLYAAGASPLGPWLMLCAEGIFAHVTCSATNKGRRDSGKIIDSAAKTVLGVRCGRVNQRSNIRAHPFTTTIKVVLANSYCPRTTISTTPQNATTNNR